MIDDVRLADVPPLVRPVMVLAFSGWNDAGEAASSSLDRLITHWGGHVIGELDPQPYTHFAAVRPAVSLIDGQRVITWPTTRVWAVRLPGCDVVAVTGPEPALRWQRYAGQIGVLAERLGVSMAVTLGALLTDVPHTRPVQVIATSGSERLLQRFDLRRPTYEGPTGIVGVLGHALFAQGIPTAALWASVPSYASQLPAPRSSAALVEQLSVLLGVDAPSLFADDIAAIDARMDGLLDDNEGLAEYVRELESFVDGNEDIEPDFPGDPEVLLAEVEHFLRQAGNSRSAGEGNQGDHDAQSGRTGPDDAESGDDE